MSFYRLIGTITIFGCSPRKSEISNTQQTMADFSIVTVTSLKSDGIAPGKLCQFCMDMFEGLTSEEISSGHIFDYHQNPSSLLASVQTGCALCKFMDQLLQRRDIQLGEDQTTKLQIKSDSQRIQGWLYPKRLSAFCFTVLTPAVFEGRIPKSLILLFYTKICPKLFQICLLRILGQRTFRFLRIRVSLWPHSTIA